MIWQSENLSVYGTQAIAANRDLMFTERQIRRGPLTRALEVAAGSLQELLP